MSLMHIFAHECSSLHPHIQWKTHLASINALQGLDGRKSVLSYLLHLSIQLVFRLPGKPLCRHYPMKSCLLWHSLIHWIDISHPLKANEVIFESVKAFRKYILIYSLKLPPFNLYK